MGKPGRRDLQNLTHKCLASGDTKRLVDGLAIEELQHVALQVLLKLWRKYNIVPAGLLYRGVEILVLVPALRVVDPNLFLQAFLSDNCHEIHSK